MIRFCNDSQTEEGTLQFEETEEYRLFEADGRETKRSGGEERENSERNGNPKGQEGGSAEMQRSAASRSSQFGLTGDEQSYLELLASSKIFSKTTNICSTNHTLTPPVERSGDNNNNNNNNSTRKDNNNSDYNHNTNPSFRQTKDFISECGSRMSVRNHPFADADENQREVETEIVEREDGEKEEMFVEVSNTDLRFSAAHFVAFLGFREPLHGHNYSIAMKLGGLIQADGYIMDFQKIKTTIKQICQSMHQRFIVPTKSDVLTIKVEDESVSIRTEDNALFVFPKPDCVFLPILHSTVEELAFFVWIRFSEMMTKAYLEERGIKWLEITVAERPGQSASYRRHL